MSNENRTKSCREIPKNHLTASPSKPSGWLPKPRVAGSSPVYRSKAKRLEYQWFNTNNKPIKSTKKPTNPYTISALFSTFCLKWQKKMGRKWGVKIKHYGNNKSNGKKEP